MHAFRGKQKQNLGQERDMLSNIKFSSHSTLLYPHPKNTTQFFCFFFFVCVCDIRAKIFLIFQEKNTFCPPALTIQNN